MNRNEFASALIFIILLLASIKSSQASGYMEPYCSGKKDLDAWAKEMPVIVLATAEEVVPKLPSDKWQKSACWAKLSIQEWIKDSGPKTVWVASLIPDYKRTSKDFEKLTYCEFQKGRTYLIFGKYNKRAPHKEVGSYIITATGKESNWSCPPNQEISLLKNYSIIEQVRNLIQAKK